MKILITGATGLIGQEIVRQCLSQKIAVHYLTTNKKKLVSELNYKGFYWNPETKEIDLACFDGVTAIINLAGASISKRWTKSYKKIVLSSRVNTIRTLHHGLSKISSQTITSFVSASAIGIYPHSLAKFYDESETKVDDSFLGDVVESWENEIDSLNVFNFNLVKIRIGLVLSNDGGALVEMVKPIRMYVGAAFGHGKQWQSWIHISDLARIFIFSVKHSLHGVYNGVAPNPITNAKLIKEVASMLNRPLILPNIPQIAMQIVLGEMSYLLFASQRVSSKKIEEEGFVFQYQNITRALNEIFSNETKDKTTDHSDIKEYV